MRLIDETEYQERLAKIPMEERTFRKAVEVAEEMPTIEAEPVKYGEWVVCGDGENVPWMCSHCGKTTAHKYKVMYGNYCPNCGARMDGDSNG